MKIQHLEITAAYASLNSDLAGLDESEAKRRLAEFGPNQVEEIAGEPLILTFAREFGHFFAIILWIAAGLTFFAEWKQPGQGMATLVSGESKALVFATGIHSAFGQITHLTQTRYLPSRRKSSAIFPHSASVLKSRGPTS